MKMTCIYKTAVLTSKKTRKMHISKIHLVKTFRKMIVVYSDNRLKHKYNLPACNGEFLRFKPFGRHNYRCPLES